MVSGALFATWVSRLPAMRDRLHASSAELGVALLCTGLGSLLAMPFTGRLCDRFGSRVVVLATALPAAGLLAFAGHLPSVPALAALLLAWGALVGCWDVAMNVQGSVVEQRAGREWMSRYHAGWSLGGILGAALGALAAPRLGLTAHFTTAAVVAAVAIVLASRTFVADARDSTTRTRPSWRGLLTPTLVLIGLVTACSTTLEGAAADWLGLLLTDEHGADPAAAASGYAVFAVAMAESRFAGTWTVETLGRGRAGRLGGIVTAVGVTATLATPGRPGVYVGAAIWGLGVAVVFPAAMSAAGEDPVHGPDAIAAVSTIGYGGFLVGPPMVGVLAQHIGLGNALWSMLPLCAGIVLAGRAAQSRRGG